MIENYPNAKRKGEALYYANVENMDFAVGMIMDCKLKIKFPKIRLSFLPQIMA